MAKKEPSQPLADTVAELERGFTEKADKKALKKILFLLDQAGYRPQPIESAESSTSDKPTAKPFECALMVSADAAGDAIFIYGIQQGQRVHWLHVSVGVLRGISRATSEETTIEEAKAKLANLLTTDHTPQILAPIDTTYLKSRIGSALPLTKSMPSVMAFWRAKFSDVPEGAHPAEKITRAETTSEDRSTVALGLDASLLWRLELGAVTPILEQMSAIQQEGLEADARKAKTAKIIGDAREELFTPELILDHSSRLLDLAYILSLRQAPEAGVVAATADDLRERGAESEYARAVLDKTVVLLVESLRQAEASQK